MSQAIEYISTLEELRAALGGESLSKGVNIPRQRLAPIDRKWLAASNWCDIATSDAEGRCDVSPRGGVRGFVLVLNDTTIVIPELRGNRRGDGYKNLLQNPHVGLKFERPGHHTTLRINGHARMVRDAPWFDRLAAGGERPVLAIVVDIEKIFYHCVKASQRIKRWDPSTWDDDGPSPREVASALGCETDVPTLPGTRPPLDPDHFLTTWNPTSGLAMP